MLSLKFKKLHPAARLPSRAHPTDAGWDLYAAEGRSLASDLASVVRTGLAVEIPPGHCLLIVGRSGLGANGVDVHAGLVDESYRGEIGVVLMAHRFGHEVNPGDRIGQAILLPVPAAEVVEAGELAPSERGGGGFGSTGA